MEKKKTNKTHNFYLNVVRFSKAVIVSSEAAVKNILGFFIVVVVGFFVCFLFSPLVGGSTDMGI